LYCQLAIFCFGLLQKLADRQSAFKMIKFQKCSDKEKCEKVLVTEMMSIEESSQEGEKILKIRKPVWQKPIIF